MGDRLVGKRVLVTSCDSYMGPPIATLFRAEGADVLISLETYDTHTRLAGLLRALGALRARITRDEPG